MQCSQRWRRSLNPSISRNNWTAEEEMDLIILVMQYGTQSWPQIAKKLGKRSYVQCRYRYIQMSKQSRVQLIFKDNHQFESQFSNSEQYEFNYQTPSFRPTLFNSEQSSDEVDNQIYQNQISSLESTVEKQSEEIDFLKNQNSKLNKQKSILNLIKFNKYIFKSNISIFRYIFYFLIIYLYK